MQTSSPEVGTAFLLQFSFSNQLPPLVFVQEFSHPLARAAEGAQMASMMIAAAARPIARIYTGTCRDPLVAAISILRCLGIGARVAALRPCLHPAVWKPPANGPQGT